MKVLEAAKALGVAEKTLYRWREKGAPWAGRGRVDLEDLRAWAIERGYLDAATLPPPSVVNADLAALPRHRRLLRLVLGEVIGSIDELRRYGSALGCPPSAVRGDAERLIREAEEPEGEPEAPLAIRDAMRAKDAPGLEHALAAVREAFAGGEIDDRMHAQFVASIKAQLASLAKRPEERPDPIAEAIDVLTADEVDALEAFRRSHARAPLAPGEGVPPPEALAGERT